MFDGELSFALKLAREMGRPDWRAMLAGMSSTEYADWHRFYSTHYFHDVLLDMHFSGLTYTVLSLFFSDPDMHPLDFSLLNRREADEEPEDDVLMQKAAGLAGGVRFGPDGNEVIPASPDVADMTEDDVMLMTVSEGIAGYPLSARFVEIGGINTRFFTVVSPILIGEKSFGYVFII